MDLGLSGKRALVLASSQGLGLGIASELCNEGANVILCGRSGDKLRNAADAINAQGQGQAQSVVIDLADKDSATRLYAAAKDILGGVDILVNNSGGPPPGPVSKPAAADWRAQFDVMVLRLIEIANLCADDMREAGWGRILTVASSGILQPIPNLAMSNTVRAALVGWNKSLSNELAADGITVNILAPGRIHTDRVDQLDAAAAERQDKSIDDVRKASRATIPAGRYGTVQEFAAVAAFLVSAPASYVTGSIVRCDGGLIRST
ncbi:SDR family oxidoreductase [Woeseia oceani]|uniref:3-oxoacyl-ACP reductase n=1 Tax=Woeseia oceani TaxID=1548547 RepID=A0A193LD02_9GAMM|nr:SDR family oxidoreductase [Woeseia oceani]ANO50269.1 3-oxoacyl-ACP reductase [Woeseia oceani]